MFSCLVLLAVFSAAQGRAVNISNAWVLPEEGFPVFYRYFRDRISWYEADAVCQFHHANLVTVDTTAQYDAVRAYLKELDISTAVWVGLIRSNPDGEFTWTDYRGLSGEGYWSSAPDSRTAPLCAAANPVADYRWEARSCGGPTVASFICELPVPQWALGNEGCMVRNIPALTILYLPESAAVQLTADCGLAEVKRVQCTGNVKRDVLLKDLACVDEETTTSSVKIATFDVTTERDNMSESTTEDTSTFSTSEKVEIVPSSTFKTPLFNENTITTEKSKSDKLNKVYMNKNIHVDFINHNNIQSNDIPRIAPNDDDFIEEQLAKKQEAKTKQILMLHEEIAHNENFANNDHFVPPLVMAKAKMSDDMTVLSIQEKHAQQLAQQGVLNYKNTHKEILPLQKEIANSQKTIDEKPLVKPAEISNSVEKDIVLKSHIPKKYNEKYISVKGKYTNPLENKNDKNEEVNHFTNFPHTTKSAEIEPTTTVNINEFYKLTTDINPVDLTVIFKEPILGVNSSSPLRSVTTLNILKPIEAAQVKNKFKTDVSTESQTVGYNLNDEIIKITLIKDANSPQPFTTEVFEITTKVPVFYDDTTNASNTTATEQNMTKSEHLEDTTVPSSPTTATMISTTQANKITSEAPHITSDLPEFTSETSTLVNISDTQNSTLNGLNISLDVNNSTMIEDKAVTNTTILTNTTEAGLEHGSDSLDEPIDDQNSPLLSGASEPLHRPPRLRRPQQKSIIKKFSPFRILG